MFVRAPQVGRVKTRLIGRLDAQRVLELYRCFVEDILATLANLEFDVVVCHDPPEAEIAMRSWLGERHDFVAQKGISLGERMAHALQTAFARGGEQAVLVGSDFPDLNAGVIREAFEKLATHDLVVGPAVDGGYYLIGFNAGSFAPHLFENMPWGTSRVFDKTVEGVKMAGLRMHCLPIWRDIDTHDDLEDFFARATATGLTHLKTVQYLHQNRTLLGF